MLILATNCCVALAQETEMEQNLFETMREGDKAAIIAVHQGAGDAQSRLSIDRFNARLRKAYPNYSFYEAWTSRRFIQQMSVNGVSYVPTPDELFNQLQKEGYTHVLIQSSNIVNSADMQFLRHMVEAAQPNIWDKELVSFLIEKLSAKQELNKLVGAFEPQLKELAKDFRCASSFPLEIADTKAIEVVGKLSELSWFDLGKVGSLEDTDAVILYLTDANATLKACLKALADNKLCRVLLLLDVKDSDKLLLDVVGCPNLSSIVEKGQALLLQFDGVVHEKVSLEHGKEKTYLRHKNLAKGLSLRPSDYLSAKMSKTELNNLVYSVFKDSTCVIATAKGDRDLVQLLEGLLDRDFVCRQGKRLKAVKGKAGQLLFYGMHRTGLSWNDLERLFADDNMAKNANADKIAKVLENDSAAVRYYKDLFGL